MQNEHVPQTDEDVNSIIYSRFILLDPIGKEAAWLLYQYYRNGRYLTVFDAYEKLLQAMLKPDKH